MANIRITDKQTVTPTGSDFMLINQAGSDKNTTLSRLKTYMNGSTALETEAQDTNSAINEVNTKATNASTGLNGIKNTIGSGTPETTSQNIIGGLNEINTKVGNEKLETIAENCTGGINELKEGVDNLTESVAQNTASLNASVKNDVQYGASVKDLDNISATGYYYYPNQSETDRNGCPDNYGGVVEHIAITENKYAIQEALSLCGKKYQRLKLNGVWQEWKEILISEYGNIELLNGWSLVDGSLECVKNGKMASLNLSIKSGVINSQGSTQIIKLPFPSKHTILYTTGNGSLTNINLTVSGDQLHVWGLTSAIERLPLNISYPVN